MQDITEYIDTTIKKSLERLFVNLTGYRIVYCNKLFIHPTKKIVYCNEKNWAILIHELGHMFSVSNSVANKFNYDMKDVDIKTNLYSDVDFHVDRLAFITSNILFKEYVNAVCSYYSVDIKDNNKYGAFLRYLITYPPNSMQIINGRTIINQELKDQCDWLIEQNCKRFGITNIKEIIQTEINTFHSKLQAT